MLGNTLWVMDRIKALGLFISPNNFMHDKSMISMADLPGLW
jgi:hypothetical protein